MKRGTHPNSLANLKRGGIENHNIQRRGSYPLPKNLLRKMPADARERVLEVLWTAISMSNKDEASKYITDKASELPELGFALQVCIRALQGKDGFKALMDILDRLFGRPKVVAEVEAEGNISLKGISVVVGDAETAQKLNNILGIKDEDLKDL